MRLFLMLFVSVFLAGCSGNSGWEQKASGDFVGCARSFGDQAEYLEQNYPTDILGREVNLNEAAECAEAAQNRQLAITYYQKILLTPPRESRHYRDNAKVRISALQSSQPFLVGGKLQENARALNAKVAQDRDEANAESDSSSQAAMLGAMAGMMGQPAYLPRGRGSNYVAPSYAPSVAGTSSRPASLPSRPAYRDATQCARMSQSNNPAVKNISNSCSGKITVWMGGEFRTVNAGSTVGYTTIARQITYACFNAPGEDICQR